MGNLEMLSHSSAGTEADISHSWIKPYYKSFNGLRGIAILLVFFCHYLVFWNGAKLATYMFTGVDLFFVLSGFLITGILYDTVRHPHFFRTFYIRRALRIFPLFYGAFLLLFLLTPILRLHYPLSIFSYFFYVGNLVVPFADLAHHNPSIIFIFYKGSMRQFVNLGHLWSLCVEEQFYLIWPAVVWLVRDRRRIMQVCVILITAIVIGRFYLYAHPTKSVVNQLVIYWSTYTRCDTILVGAWIALWLRGRTFSRLQIRRIGVFLFTMPAIALTAGVMFQSEPKNGWTRELNPFLGTIGFTLIAISASGILMLALDETNLLSRMLQTRWLSSLGVISYGFYFLHAMPLTLFMRYRAWHPHRAILVPFIAFALTVLLATVSFRFYESRFLKLKSRLAPGHRSIPSGREHIDFA